MKTLVEYIKESCNKDECESKSFSLSLKDLEGADEVLKSLSELDGVTVEDDKVTFDVQKGAGASEGLKVVTDFLDKRSKDIKYSSDEAYAEKVHKLQDKAAEAEAFATYTEEEPADKPEETDDKKGEKKDGKEEE